MITLIDVKRIEKIGKDLGIEIIWRPKIIFGMPESGIHTTGIHVIIDDLYGVYDYFESAERDTFMRIFFYI